MIGKFICALAMAAAFSAHAADADNGGRIAERWCAQCHIVSSDQKSANIDVPSFDKIARSVEIDPRRIEAYLKVRHTQMPDMSLTRGEIDDLLAYIRKQGND